jgi:hypothetical protein
MAGVGSSASNWAAEVTGSGAGKFSANLISDVVTHFETVLFTGVELAISSFFANPVAAAVEANSKKAFPVANAAINGIFQLLVVFNMLLTPQIHASALCIFGLF